MAGTTQLRLILSGSALAAALLIGLQGPLHLGAHSSGTASVHSFARGGADDAPGDNRGNDGALHARGGADDAPGDNRGNDGALHARGGADDAPGDNRGHDA